MHYRTDKMAAHKASPPPSSEINDSYSHFGAAHFAIPGHPGATVSPFATLFGLCLARDVKLGCRFQQVKNRYVSPGYLVSYPQDTGVYIEYNVCKLLQFLTEVLMSRANAK